MDFRDGLILPGRDVFTRAVDDPDTLADVPVVRVMADEDAFREHLSRLSAMFLP